MCQVRANYSTFFFSHYKFKRPFESTIEQFKKKMYFCFFLQRNVNPTAPGMHCLGCSRWLRATRAEILVPQGQGLHLPLRVSRRWRSGTPRQVREHEFGYPQPGLHQSWQRGHADRRTHDKQVQYRYVDTRINYVDEMRKIELLMSVVNQLIYQLITPCKL